MNSWDKYPVKIEEDLNGNMFLFVDIFIAGEKVTLQLDTGSGNGLAVKNSLWQKLSRNIQSPKTKKGSDHYPYIGSLDCKRAVFFELPFGQRLVKNAKVSIFSDDCPLLDESDALVGMQFFLDTAVALDFENYLMWVKK